MQSSGKNCSLAPDLVLWEPFFQRVFFSEGVFFLQTPVSAISGNEDGATTPARAPYYYYY